MKDRDRRAGIVSGLSLLLAMGAPTAAGAQSAELNVPDYTYRVAVITPRTITVCYTDNTPVEQLSKPDDMIAERILVFDADCMVSTGNELEVFEGVNADLENYGGYEFTELGPYKEAGATEPPVFEGVSDSSTFDSVEESSMPQSPENGA